MSNNNNNNNNLTDENIENVGTLNISKWTVPVGNENDLRVPRVLYNTTVSGRGRARKATRKGRKATRKGRKATRKGRKATRKGRKATRRH